MSYAETELKVLRWAEDRLIIKHSNPLAQFGKTLEEAGELLTAAAKLAVLDKLKHHLDEDVYIHEREICLSEFRDGAGDVLVTLINACALADVDLVTCLEEAYDQIKDRKGKLNAAGKFVKEPS